jgi:prepilin-type N-terminal cleavage/methylation domain-containing protein
MTQGGIWQSGFSLLELTVAISLAAVALTAILGLLPAGIQTNESAQQETAAIQIAHGIIADLRAAKLDSTKGSKKSCTSPRYHPHFKIPLEPGAPTLISPDASELFASETGDLLNKLEPSARFQVRLQLNAPSEPHRAITGYLKIWWPAGASEQNAAGSLEIPLALQRPR